MTAAGGNAHARIDRSEAVPAIIGDPADFLIVSGLAGSAKDIGALTRETPNTFLFGGAMGGALTTALGLALAQPTRRVLVVTGDGDLLMSLGALATIGAMQPSNLAVLCVDNARYQETGDQRTHTSMGVDLAQVATGCGFGVTRDVSTMDAIAEARTALRQSNGPVFVLLRVSEAPPPKYARNWHAQEAKTAFRKALLGHR